MNISINYFLKISLTAVVLSIVYSCAATPYQDYHHRSFNQASIENGGVAVIGVVSSFQKSPSTRYLGWANRFESSIQENRRYPLISSKDVEHKLGINYSFILDSYQETNQLGPTEVKLIKAAGLVAQYGVFARVQRNEKIEMPEQVYGVNDVDGYTFRDRSRVVLETARIVTVTAQVIDLRSGRVVWQSTQDAAPKKSTEFIAYKGNSFGRALTIATLNTLSNGFYKTRQPRAPSFESTFELVLDKLARQLPLHTVY